MPVRDEDDWVGEPPEGHYTRDRAKPEFWRNRRASVAWTGIAIALLILLIVLLLG